MKQTGRTDTAIESGAREFTSHSSPAGFGRATSLTSWRFHLGEVDGAAAPSFDDSSWHAVRVPHDWSVGQKARADLAACTGFLPGVLLMGAF